MATRHDTWHGMHWIRSEKRYAVYARDSFKCLWCDQTPDKLTLDHLVPESQHGSNHQDNLVCCCRWCNSSRQDRPVAVFAAEHGDKAPAILARIRETIARPINVQTAKLAITRAGGFVAACQEAVERRRQLTTGGNNGPTRHPQSLCPI
jgi:hypothetical protein